MIFSIHLLLIAGCSRRYDSHPFDFDRLLQQATCEDSWNFKCSPPAEADFWKKQNVRLLQKTIPGRLLQLSIGRLLQMPKHEALMYLAQNFGPCIAKD
ncbi:hypothetical protein V6N13_052131 [Hibiscus sabdariffa]